VDVLFCMVISGSCRVSPRQLLLFRCAESITQSQKTRLIWSENVLHFHLAAMSYP
jgi:hypothetical protein